MLNGLGQNDRQIGADRMRMKRFCILVVGLMILLSGCIKGDEQLYSIQEEKERTDVTVTLEIFAWETEEENLRILSEAFMQKNDNISVNINILPASEYSQQMMGIKNGMRTGDVIFFSVVSETAVWAEKGVLQSLEPWLEETEDRYDSWYGKEGEMYSEFMLPYRTSKWAVFYNKTLFDERGIPYPESGWTWEDYARTAVKLTGQVGVDKI